MRRHKVIIQNSIFAMLFLSLGGCNIKGANEPFSFAPSTSYSIWKAPKKAKKKPNNDHLEKEMEDYAILSKEHPISLAELIDIALYRNPETKQSWAEARVSAAEFGQSLKKYFILADVGSHALRERFDDFVGDAHSPGRAIIYDTRIAFDLQLSYTILDFGQTRYSSLAALESLYNADWSHNSQIQTTIQTVITDYYNYLYQKQLLLAANQDVLNAEISLSATQEKFSRGLADVSDIVQAKTSYLQQKLNVVSEKELLNNSYTKLVKDMGLFSSGDLHFQEYPNTIKIFDIETLDALIIQANDFRPDLQAAESNVSSQLANIKANKAKNYPTITGEFDIGRTYFNGPGKLGLRDDLYDFKLLFNLTFPLFQGFFIQNSIKIAKAELEKAQADLDLVKLNVIQEVTNYRNDVLFAKESLKYSKDYLESAEKDFKVNLKKYKVGTGTIVELINAQTNVADARAKFAKAKNSWYTSIANLAHATGILTPPKDSIDNSYETLIEIKESHL